MNLFSRNPINIIQKNLIKTYLKQNTHTEKKILCSFIAFEL